MMITLPDDLESRLQATVQSGRFASVEDAIAEAARLLLHSLAPTPQPGQAADSRAHPGLGSIGAMRDDADLLDRAVEHAMKVREERPWRLGSVE